MQPPELREPTVGAAGSDLAPPRNSVGKTHYRQGGRSATFGPPRLIHDDGVADRALQKARAEVRERVCRLPLAAHRLGGLVNAGRLPYRRTWDALHHAALEAGAGEAWVLRCLYGGFAASNVSPTPTPALWALSRGIE
jgi:hypothetical protein